MMKNRLRNYLIIVALICLLITFHFTGIRNFFTGFIAGMLAMIVIGEIFYLVRRKDMQHYILRIKE